MKTVLISLLSATLVGFAFMTSVQPVDAADFISLFFVTGLVLWTLAQYGQQPRAISLNRVSRVQQAARPAVLQATRLAA